MYSLYCCAISFGFFYIFDRKLSSLISVSIPKYRTLTEEQRQDWDTRNASTVHALIVSFTCIYVVIWEKSLHDNLVSGYSKIGETNMAIATGYLCCDLMLLLSSGKIKNNIGYIIHHSVSLCAYYLALSAGLLSYFGNFRLLAELSTPFVNLRWALAATGNKKGNLYFYNGCIMTFSFFVCRIVVMPYYYYMVWKVARSELYRESLSLPVHYTWISVCVVLDILNIFWFRKMLSGVQKHLVRPDVSLDSFGAERKLE